MPTNPTEFFAETLLGLQSYRVPNSAGMLKLDAMENPWPLPDELKPAWLAVLRDLNLNRYPDPTATVLVNRLRQQFAVPQQCDILLGNGSDELLQLLYMSVLHTSTKPTVLSVEPGFAMYHLLAKMLRINYIGVPLEANTFSLDLPAIEQAIAAHQPELIILAYPNNPTGNLFDINAIRAIIAQAPGLVIIDEAYQPFAQTSLLSYVSEYPNVLLLRTVSKLGLAGIRLGYLIGQKAWLTQLNKLRLPYNINSLTQATADFALQHYPVFLEQAAEIVLQREQLWLELATMPGIQPYPSQANFILFQTPTKQATRIFNRLKQQQILIKNLDNTYTALKNCLRVTVGTASDNYHFKKALKNSI